MTPPGSERLFSAMEATWPPAQCIRQAPWTLREGKGGGQRVSSATADSPVTETDIAPAETRMRALGQVPIFMIPGGSGNLDAILNRRGYGIVDPVTIYLRPASEMVDDVAPASAIPTWPPLAIQREIWSEGGIGAGRIAVMERAKTPKTAILGRTKDTPAGTAFVALDHEIAMVHALEVNRDARHQGVATRIMRRAANWAVGLGAEWLAVLVTQANVPGNALYRKLGMQPAARYHYRRAPEAGS